MKNKNLLIGLVILAVVLVGGGMLVLSSNNKTEPVVVEQMPSEEQVVVVKPEEIGLTLTASADNRKVILGVANTSDISGLDYELSYTSKGDIPRGAIGHIDIKQPGKAVTQGLTLGTCSDVCHYDQEVTDIKVILKVVKTDGTTVQVEKSLEL